MNTAIILAVVALIGSLFSTVITTFGFPVFQARRDSKKLLDLYREPLLAASYELQSRLYNILRLGFIERYIKEDAGGKEDAAMMSTLYVVAQFFCWLELIRRDVHYISFARDGQTREFAQLLRDIGSAFLTDSYGTQFMIWRVEQRGIGERMIASTGNRRECLGYASFIDARSSMSEWLDPTERDLRNIHEGGRQRLTIIQHLLLALVEKLDDKHMRYPFEMKEA